MYKPIKRVPFTYQGSEVNVSDFIDSLAISQKEKYEFGNLNKVAIYAQLEPLKEQEYTLVILQNENLHSNDKQFLLAEIEANGDISYQLNDELQLAIEQSMHEYTDDQSAYIIYCSYSDSLSVTIDQRNWYFENALDGTGKEVVAVVDGNDWASVSIQNGALASDSNLLQFNESQMFTNDIMNFCDVTMEDVKSLNQNQER